jgi:hypothetical protein
MPNPASLTVLSGPLAGTRLDIDGSEDEILVGADPDCRPRPSTFPASARSTPGSRWTRASWSSTTPAARAACTSTTRA